jgi:hypothetical protein
MYCTVYEVRYMIGFIIQVSYSTITSLDAVIWNGIDSSTNRYKINEAFVYHPTMNFNKS